MTIQNLFLQILNMSVAAGIAICIVLLLRQVISRAPKAFSYVLWAAVLLRLICPILPESPLGMLHTPVEIYEKVQTEAALQENETDAAVLSVQEGAAFAETEDVQMPETADAPTAAAYAMESVSNAAAVVEAAQDPVRAQRIRWLAAGMQHLADWHERSGWAGFASVLWAEGVVLMLLWSFVQYVQMKQQLKSAVCEGNGVWRVDFIDTPFVMGLIRPRIYLPVDLGTSECDYVLAHERHHIRRGDPVWRLLAMAALCLHWFNPLVWLAFFLSEVDMEMSCDEAVMRRMHSDIRADYAQSLLRFSTGAQVPVGTPLAFGEKAVKTRIVNVVHYRKPMVGVLALCAVLCLVTTGCLATKPREAEQTDAIEKAGTAAESAAADSGETDGAVETAADEAAEKDTTNSFVDEAVQKAREAEAYVFPLDPDTTNINDFDEAGGRRAVLTIPEDELKAMSTEALAKTLFENSTMTAFGLSASVGDEGQNWLNYIRNAYNIYPELESREDMMDALYAVYLAGSESLLEDEDFCRLIDFDALIRAEQARTLLLSSVIMKSDILQKAYEEQKAANTQQWNERHPEDPMSL